MLELLYESAHTGYRSRAFSAPMERIPGTLLSRNSLLDLVGSNKEKVTIRKLRMGKEIRNHPGAPRLIHHSRRSDPRWVAVGSPLPGEKLRKPASSGAGYGQSKQQSGDWGGSSAGSSTRENTLSARARLHPGKRLFSTRKHLSTLPRVSRRSRKGQLQRRKADENALSERP